MLQHYDYRNVLEWFGNWYILWPWSHNFDQPLFQWTKAVTSCHTSRKITDYLCTKFGYPIINRSGNVHKPSTRMRFEASAVKIVILKGNEQITLPLYNLFAFDNRIRNWNSSYNRYYWSLHRPFHYYFNIHKCNWLKYFHWNNNNLLKLKHRNHGVHNVNSIFS